MKDNECKVYSDTTKCEKADCRDCNHRFLLNEIRQMVVDEREKTIEEFSHKAISHFSDWKMSEADEQIKHAIDQACEGIKEIAEQIKCKK